MSRRAATFTQADMARALRAAGQVAPGKWRVRVSRDGEMLVEPVEGPATVSAAELSPLSPAGAPERPVALIREPRL